MRMHNFKQKLIETINQSGLSVEEVFYVWKDLFDELSITYNNILMQEKKNENESI